MLTATAASVTAEPSTTKISGENADSAPARAASATESARSLLGEGRLGNVNQSIREETGTDSARIERDTTSTFARSGPRANSRARCRARASLSESVWSNAQITARRGRREGSFSADLRFVRFRPNSIIGRIRTRSAAVKRYFPRNPQIADSVVRSEAFVSLDKRPPQGIRSAL